MAEHCTACGAKTDLTMRSYHVGGQGYVWCTECVDKQACQARQDSALVALDRVLAGEPGRAA